MNNIYHRRLTLPAEFKVNEVANQAAISFYDEQPLELNNFLSSVGVSILKCHRFYIQPGGVILPHADGDHINNYAKLNYVHQGQNTIMKWYRLNHNVVLTPGVGDIKSKYLSAPLKDLTEAHAAPIGFPSLVNSGQIHSVINNSTEPRICYSFILTYAENPKHNLNWDDAVIRFNDYMDLSLADGV